jgi:hypothetical protein
MSNVRYDMANMASLGVASVTINSATTTTFDFGTPDDLNLAALSGYNPGDRVLVILSATTAGTTNNLTWVVQDAADSSGSIGTPAAATLSACTRRPRCGYGQRLLRLRGAGPAGTAVAAGQGHLGRRDRHLRHPLHRVGRSERRLT